MTDSRGRGGTPMVSVIIPTRNRPAFLRDALHAIREGEWQDFEVWVIDQSDDSASEQVVSACGDERLHYRWLATAGACHARNVGIALSRAPLVAFLDDDCCPQPDWLGRIVSAFAADPDLQFIFGALVAPPHDPALGGYPEFRPTPAFQASRSPRRVAIVAAGANMSCRRTFLDRIGGFDEVTQLRVGTMKNDDSSMNYKVFRSGAKWAARADIAVIHVHGFRRHDELWALFREYTYACGVTLARSARRGDLLAVWYFVLDQGALLWQPVWAALHLRKPRGIRTALVHAQGFIDGLRLPSRAGYVGGPALRGMIDTV